MLLITYVKEGLKMLINNAILGLLSYRPMTGYEIKKIIQDSSYMHWSGNNNQIYKALLELAEDGFVTAN
jgi:DNA-binding PadR family transcriptional regulator